MSGSPGGYPAPTYPDCLRWYILDAGSRLMALLPDEGDLRKPDSAGEVPRALPREEPAWVGPGRLVVRPRLGQQAEGLGRQPPAVRAVGFDADLTGPTCEG